MRARHVGFVLPAWSPSVSRTMDARTLNAVANHPDVRPWLGGLGPLDLSPTLANAANLAYEADGGGFLALHRGDGRYDAHSLFLPEQRIGTVRAVKSALDHFFASSDGVLLETLVYPDNKPAAALAQLAGFIPSPDPLRWHLTIDVWAMRSSAARQHGEWLHAAMAAAQVAYGSLEGPHDDDVDHNRIAGAAVLMVRSANAVKALTFYNAWAEGSGFPPIALLNLHPIVIDLGGMVVELRGSEMEVLQCQ